MTFTQFVGDYWLAISGIISFIFAIGYTYSSFDNLKKELARQEEANKLQRESDTKDFTNQLKEQRKDHDEKISDLRAGLSSTNTKVDTMKDKTTDLIQDIQLSIKEIMTILREQKK